MDVDLNGQLGSGSRTNPINGAVAQLVEQWPEEPRVAGSNPARTTKNQTVLAISQNDILDDRTSGAFSGNCNHKPEITG